MALRPHLDSLLHYDPVRSSSTVNVWIAHPSPSEEASLGKLAVITTIGHVARLNHEIINLVQEELRAQYYQSPELSMAQAFEQALRKTNERLHEVISEGASQWVATANFLVIAIKQQYLLLSNVGRMEAFRIRHERLVPILTDEDAVTPNPLRLFNQTIGGQAEPGDRMVFCTPSLLDYFSLEKLRRTVLDGHPHEVVRTLEATVLGAEPTYAMGALVAEFESAPDTIRPSYRPSALPVHGRTAPQASMDTMLARQRSTEKILTPSIWPAMTDLGQRLGQAFGHFVRVTMFRRPLRRKLPAGTMLPSSSRTTRMKPAWWTKAGQLIRLAMHQLIVTIKRVRIPHRPTAPPSTANVAPSRRRWLDQSIVWFRRLRPQQQILLGLLLLVIISLTTALAQRSYHATPLPVATIPQQVRQLISHAQAALLYGGDDVARQDIQKADALVKELPTRTKAQRSVHDQFLAQLQSLHQRADHITIITHPTVLVDLHHAFPSTQPRQLYLAGTTIMAVDPASNSVMLIPPGSAPVPTQNTNTLDTGRITTGAVSGVSAMTFATDRQTFIEFDAKKLQWKPLDANFSELHPRMQFISSFQGRLYVLDTNHNHIVRFTRGGLSLGTAVQWLKTAAQLSAARAAVVDGSIYVLQPNGQVEQYVAGTVTDFHLSTVTPALTDVTRLWTDLNSQHLYLLDPTHHRLVVMDKQGHLVDQYESPLWTDVRDIIANEKTKTAYLLNGSTIFSIQLLH